MPFISAHAAAVQRLTVVLQSSPVSRSWPFIVQRVAPEGAPLAGKASGAVALEIVPPVGNTGGTLNRSAIHD